MFLREGWSMKYCNIEVHKNYDQVKRDIRSFAFGILGGLIANILLVAIG